MSSSRDRLLQQCTVKLVPADSRDWGTGFLVTPNHILTCAHVVEGHEVIPVWWRGQAWATARIEQIFPTPVDLALLQIEPTEGEQPPWVLLSETFNPFDRLYVYGYPDDFPDGGSVTIQCEGDVQEQGVTLIKAQAGQVRPGHSGSPALNWETGQVCGVVSDTRSRSTDLGGLLIPVSTLFSHVPDIQVQNRAAHSSDSLWFTLPLRTLAVSQRRSTVLPPQFSTYNPATFAGRTAETATLTTCLNGSCRILAITGMTGIGKTALAERVVDNVMESLLPERSRRQQGMGRQHESLPYRRFSLDNLSLTSDFSSSGVALLLELGEETTLADQQDPANLVSHILARLRSHPCRLQIDSLERLLRGNEQEGWSEFCDPLWLDLLQKFLAGTDCPSQLLLTSQDIPGDLDTVASRYPQFWHCEPLQGLNTAEQRTLFQNLGLNPTDADWEILQSIGSFYDGHPLVLQVITEEIRQPPFSGNITRYWQHYAAEFTAVPAATAHKLDRSRLFRRRVRQRVEQSIQRLPEAARQMLCASAVFRRPVPIDFWYAMLPDGDPQAAFDTLQDRHLVDYAPMESGDSASLTPQLASREDVHVTQLTSDEPRRTTTSGERSRTTAPLLIRQHNLIRSVAYALLKTDPLTWEAAERQAAHLWLTEHNAAPNAPNIEKLRGYLEAFEHYFSIEAWDLAKVIPLTIINGVTENELHWQLGRWGYYQEQICLYKKLLSLYQAINIPFGEWYAWQYMGFTYESCGKSKQALECYQNQLTSAYSIGNFLDGQRIALANLIRSCNSLGKPDQANIYFKNLSNLNLDSNSLQVQSLNTRCKADILSALGEYDMATQYRSEQLYLTHKANNIRGEIVVLNTLGFEYMMIGDHKNSIASHAQALALANLIGDKWHQASSLVFLGHIFNVPNGYEEAIKYYEKSLEISVELGDIQGAANSLNYLGSAYSGLKQYAKSINLSQRALRILREIGDRKGEGIALSNLGITQLKLGQHPESLSNNQTALEIFREIGVREGEAEALKNLAELHHALGEIEVARDYCQQALALAIELGIPLKAECETLLSKLEQDHKS